MTKNLAVSTVAAGETDKQATTNQEKSDDFLSLHGLVQSTMVFAQVVDVDSKAIDTRGAAFCRITHLAITDALQACVIIDQSVPGYALEASLLVALPASLDTGLAGSFKEVVSILTG